MTTSLTRRLDQLERGAEEQRRPIRERVHRICRERGANLSPAEIEGIVTRAVGVRPRIARLRASGMTDAQITEQMLVEVPG